MLKIHHHRLQCCGTKKFWYGSGSGDPYLWLMGPDPDAFIYSKLFTRKKFISFIKYIVKCEWKNFLMDFILDFILCVCENFCDTILLWFRNRNYLRFRFQLFDKLRFRFHKAKSYGSYDSGSGSTTLEKTKHKFFFASLNLKPLKKGVGSGVGSGSISQRYGSIDMSRITNTDWKLCRTCTWKKDCSAGCD
jgi:hypothetical protein